MAKRNEIAPRDGARAGVPAQLDAVREASLRARTTEDLGEADALRKDALALRQRLLAEQDLARVAELLIEVSECYAWGCRRIGELAPAPAPGKRTDLAPTEAEGDATSGGSPPRFDRKTVFLYRQLAAVPRERFEKALVEAREAGRPITQTALLALAPRPSGGGADGRQVDGGVWLRKELERLKTRIAARQAKAKKGSEVLREFLVELDAWIALHSGADRHAFYGHAAGKTAPKPAERWESSGEDDDEDGPVGYGGRRL